MTAPVEMTFLYLQDFSALGDFLADSKTSPADSVGGDWPLLGYAPTAGGPLDAAKEYVIADTYLVLAEGAARDDVAQAQTYLDDVVPPPVGGTARVEIPATTRTPAPRMALHGRLSGRGGAP